MNLETNLTILKHHKGGEGVNAITRSLGLPQSSVSTVLKNTINIKKSGETCTTLMAKTMTHHRKPIMDEMGKLLKLLIDDHIRSRMPVSTSIISAKALSICQEPSCPAQY
ncbi:hypothetical protein Pcinc_024544 [Petrolisthes cinctipes]|uniref:HTH psq-type domain-containing protein n=1 Tax=Petrolisthes cinctipes TaxID=88211 RepID=A0AAE1FB23_PETCI|nr:hypothetical protein Pcinc_024544 [Petrolisthes cinctipes]